MFLYDDLSVTEENVLLFWTLSVSQYWCNFSLWWTGWLLLVSVTLTYRLILCCLSHQPTCPNWKTIPVAKRQKLKWYWHSKTPRNFLLKVTFYSWKVTKSFSRQTGRFSPFYILQRNSYLSAQFISCETQYAVIQTLKYLSVRFSYTNACRFWSCFIKLRAWSFCFDNFRSVLIRT